jgi:hypothetical protein
LSTKKVNYDLSSLHGEIALFAAHGMRVQPALLPRADEFPMNLRGVCGFFDNFFDAFASQERTSENSSSETV